MAEFCECGSLVIDNHCTNKHCSHRAVTKPAPAKRAAAKKKDVSKGLNASTPVVKPTNPRRASKCITYNLYDTESTRSES